MIESKISKDQVENITRLYWQEKLAYSQIAAVYGVSKITVKNFMVRHGIPHRDRSAANSLMRKRPEVAEKRRETYLEKGIPSSTKGKNWTLKKQRYNLKSRGANNSNWRGGKTKTILLIRMMTEYSEWRSMVFKRDDYTCLLCGRRTCAGDKVIIHADHIYPLSRLVEDHQIKGSVDAAACQALWDTNNGRTLCKECHKKTDTWGPNLTKKK